MPEFTLNRAYSWFDRIITTAEPRLTDTVPGVLQYDRTALARRLSQRLVEIGLSSFIRQCADLDARGIDPLALQGRTITCDGLKLDLEAGRATPTVSRWVKSVAEFWAHWLRVLLASLWHAARAPRTGTTEPAGLLFGIGVEDLADEGLARFCDEGPIMPLREAGQLIIECPLQVAHARATRIRYARNPWLCLDRLAPPMFLDLLRFLVEHLEVAGAFVRASLVHPLSCLLAKDLAYHALVARLNRCGAIASVVTTNSNYHAQPLWMRALPGRQFRSHMVWYSQNSVPLVYRTGDVRAIVPSHRYLEVDEMWVWTDGFAAYLRTTGARGTIHVVGPIIWHLPDAGPAAGPRNDPRIAVFDVTPFTLPYVRRLGLTPRLYYYHPENARKFIEDILEVRDELQRRLRRKISVALKHKRTPTPFHDQDYVATIRRLADTGRIDLIPPETDLYSLIRSSALVLAIPNSSPALIAAHMGVPAVYYDPTESLLPVHEFADRVHFASGKRELQEEISQLMRRDA